MIENFILNYKNSLLGRYTKNLFQFMPKKVTLALCLMVLISLTQGLSLILLVPLLQLVGLNVAQGSLGQIAGIVSTVFTSLGLQLNIVTVLIIYVAVISCIAILNRLQTLMTSEIQFQFAAHMRKQLYMVITNSNWLFLSKMKSSNFAHALTNEIERISNGTGRFLSLLSSIMILIVYIIFALKLAGIITGIIFIIGIGILLLLRRMVSKSRSSGQEITRTTQDLYSSILQHLDGMKTIKSFGMQEENIRIFSNQTNNVAKNYLNSIQTYADVRLLFDVGTVIVLAIMVFILLEIIKLPTASLFLLIYLFIMMIPQFSIIQNSYQYFINMLPAYNNVIMLEEQCLENKEAKESLGERVELNNVVELKNVWFSYQSDEYFSMKDLNLKICAGKITAIVGPSGAGKSTVADLVMGLIQPNEGEITVDDIPINKNFHGYWNDQIGYVAQETFLFNETIRFNLLLAQPKANKKDIIEALKLASANEFVSKLPQGLDTFIGDRGVKLSGGELQRLALARALIKKPSLLLLDEATSNLDSKNEKKILNAIENLHSETTVLIISHKLLTIKNADYIYLMDEGQIIESGTWDELLKKEEGEFGNICKSQGINW